jgi:hypothetical protein
MLPIQVATVETAISTVDQSLTREERTAALPSVKTLTESREALDWVALPMTAVVLPVDF